ncbi:MAG: YdiU family protein [Thiomonas sp.]|uniref:protein adenylyltransferase SelO n=1 Tax=Thiomonas sp. TaxID=2047785 RepID=UPI002A35E44F|nr:YdiU family protein [Thiomonas sp.]MDY0330301.1 YdiU family protein [Thiomonas sp.]
MTSAALDTPASAPAASRAWPPLAQHFAALGEAFSVPVAVSALPDPVLVASSAEAAALVGLTPTRSLDDERDWALAFGGHVAAISANSRATVYAGHQFGNWAGQLGDGRALLLGDWPDASGGQHSGGHARWEVQFKGSGRTPFSRMGDGWAVLRSSIREFLCSEAMAALGLPTTRALCIVGSSRPVRRERIETAAMVTRLSPSFVRFGHFEHFSYSGQTAPLRALADWVIAQYAPQCAEAPQPALALLQWVVERTARLIAQWQAVGFIHGVMNTDNMSILGWTIDYGPFAFLDAYDPLHTPNTTDREGRYAYGRQPAVAHWNLLALGQALLPLIDKPESALEAVNRFRPQYVQAMQQQLAAKLGLTEPQPDDGDLFQELLDTMQANRSDWTLTFRALAKLGADASEPIPAALADQFRREPQAFADWVARYRERLRAENRDDAARAAAMNAVNPHIVLRHYLAQAAIAQAEAGDFAEVRRLLHALQRPFDAQAAPPHYAEPPPEHAPPACLSCSS